MYHNTYPRLCDLKNTQPFSSEATWTSEMLRNHNSRELRTPEIVKHGLVYFTEKTYWRVLYHRIKGQSWGIPETLNMCLQKPICLCLCKTGIFRMTQYYAVCGKIKTITQTLKIQTFVNVHHLFLIISFLKIFNNFLSCKNLYLL